MSLSCSCGLDLDADWFYEWNATEPLKRFTGPHGTKCASCREWICIGTDCIEFGRWRHPETEMELVEHDCDESAEIWLPSWYYCTRCAHQALALHELGFCWDLGGDRMADLVREYRVEYQGVAVGQ